MLQPAEQLGLQLEAASQALREQPATHDLQCDRAARVLLHGLVDRAHPALTEHAHQPVAPDSGRVSGRYLCSDFLGRESRILFDPGSHGPESSTPLRLENLLYFFSSFR
ncbi:MAG TPA: hypothetical protein VFW45_00015 [Candidatus Polarisedimenticolia bacterium]|nr:hypothetical protein [Candidatus Polarisedimenticolia bacterium]